MGGFEVMRMCGSVKMVLRENPQLWFDEGSLSESVVASLSLSSTKSEISLGKQRLGVVRGSVGGS